MANIKNLVLKKKIEGIIYDLYVKTSIEQVDYDDATTLAAKLQTMLTDIADSKEKLAALLGEGSATSITEQINTAVQAAVDAINNDSDPTSVAGKIKAVQAAVDAINNETTGILATAKAYTDAQIGFSGDETLAGKTVKQYVGEEGTKELNAEYAYNGTTFVELGSILDLSAYSTTAQVESLISTAKSEAIEAAATDATTKADAVTAALNEYKTSNDAVVATKARFIVGTDIPEDLTESDVFGMIVTA